MDAPKGRYRVEEKDGRLTVIDTATGAPASSVTPPRQVQGIVSSPLGPIDRYARLLLGLVVKRWDEEGRAILAWEWEENGRTQRWDAALGAPEQRRLARALAAVLAFPLLVLLSIFAGFGLTLLLLPVVLPATFWGVWSIMRLRRGTRTTGGA
ncbi:MAG TPA: hypothetical protein VE891_01045 [Allosphingosinicella sp.]|nr:hypothetical protein [Allosphingosinicella sp.]